VKITKNTVTAVQLPPDWYWCNNCRN